ncbi:MED6-domain-containing protein [Ganoderma leucocontextum]|nr:MED6-domain-containing protein [Ganoderma leucocontextum]
MDINLHSPDDYSHRFFMWHEWIQVRAMHGPLTAENAFEYFTTSMFYDKQSNNQVLRMQTMHTGAPLVNEAEELKRFTGIEFALVHSEAPSLFIIHKREQLSPDEVRPLAVYFIFNNRIYQSPDVYSLTSNRLVSGALLVPSGRTYLMRCHSLRPYIRYKSLDILRAHRPAYKPRTGFVWPVVEPSSGDTAAKKRSQDVETATETGTQEAEALDSKRRQNNMLLFNAMRTTAVHARESFQLPAAPSEDTVPETPATATAGRSSVTPAPAPGGTATRAPSIAPPPQEPAKGPPGGGKKKKKSKPRSTWFRQSKLTCPCGPGTATLVPPAL